MGGMIDGLGRMRCGVGIGWRGIILGPGGVYMGSGINLAPMVGVECLGWERMAMGCLGVILGFRLWRVIRIFGIRWGTARRVIEVEICKEWR